MTLDKEVKLLDVVKATNNLDNTIIPNGTIINVKSDGTGDFITLKSAIDFLTNKIGINVIIQLDDGDFLINPDEINLDGNAFNIKNLVIQGNGNDKTFIKCNQTVDYSWMFTIKNGAYVTFRNLTIISTQGNKTTSYRCITLENCSSVIIERLTIVGTHDSLYVTTGSKAMIKYGANFENCNCALTADSGGNISCSWNASITFTNINHALEVRDGGTITFNVCNTTYTNVSYKSNVTVNSLTSSGWISKV